MDCGVVASKRAKRSKGKYRKIHLKCDVNTAARERCQYLLHSFPNVYLTFSGGKDSGVALNLFIEEARKLGRLPVDVLIVDLEAQYQHTIDFIQRMVEREEINAYWVCLPLSLRNAVSQFQPKWMCWEPNRRECWLRKLPSHDSVISDFDYFPFFQVGMEFEEFVEKFGYWYQQKKQTQCACVIAIRSDESLHRYMTIKNQSKKCFNGVRWTTEMSPELYKAYPLYDWSSEDIWIANGCFGWDYNRIYDLMYLAGVSLSQQRLCQPFGDDQRKGLWLYQILEPNTWQKLVERVEGCNFGARYSKGQGRIIGYYKFELPAGYTYREYSKYLLRSMPPSIEQHYRQRIYQFLTWWRRHGRKHGITSIPDMADKKLEAKRKVPSWRRICKVLIKNDYWCRGLSFAQTQKLTDEYSDLYKQYLQKKRV
ncbi:phosphoadenosine phosphosulfate reductase [Vibrio xuii]|nr:phosphoadenosine phosphosulfate reductase [Vibrio xuii]